MLCLISNYSRHEMKALFLFRRFLLFISIIGPLSRQKIHVGNYSPIPFLPLWTFCQIRNLVSSVQAPDARKCCTLMLQIRNNFEFGCVTAVKTTVGWHFYCVSDTTAGNPHWDAKAGEAKLLCNSPYSSLNFEPLVSLRALTWSSFESRSTDEFGSTLSLKLS